MDTTTQYAVDGWHIDSAANRLTKDGTEVRLEPRVMQVLVYLVAHPGETVSKDALMEAVWQDMVVTEHSINKAISKLRRVFGDDARQPRIIATISKKGYRLIAPVATIPGPKYPAAPPHTVVADSTLAPITHLSRLSLPAWTSSLIIAGLLLLAIVLWATWSSDATTPQPFIAATNIKPLTTTVGLEMRVSFSPDDQTFVFAHKDPTTLTWNIYKQHNHAVTQLTDTPNFEAFPRYSPDGRHIAFVRYWDEATGLFLLSPDADRVETLLFEERYPMIGFDWSPDGQQIIYAASQGPNRASQLFLYTLATNERRVLTMPDSTHLGDRLPMFSPDGTSILFSRTGPELNDDLYQIATNGTSLKRLTYDHTFIVGMDWSPTTQDIYYCSHKDETYELIRLTPKGTKHSLLKTMSSKLSGAFPTISNAGDKLAFEQWHYRRNIYQVRLDRKTDSLSPPTSFVTSTYSDWNAQFSPDGEYIVFTTDRSGKIELWLGNKHGTPLERLAKLPAGLRVRPHWSPDGRFIVYAAKEDTAFNTYLIDVEHKELTLFESHASDPMFSRDGQWIYFSTSRHHNGYQQIWKKPMAGGAPLHIPALGGTVSTEAPDGQSLFFTKVNQPGLWRLLEDETEERILDDLHSKDDNNWVVVEDGIYYIKRQYDDTPVLAYLDLNTFDQRLYPESDLNSTYSDIFGLSLAPDGQTLIYGKLDYADSDLMYIDL